MKSTRKSPSDPLSFYGVRARAHLDQLLEVNRKPAERVLERLVKDVKQGRSLFLFGSGHSAIFCQELYHRAGGVSFVIPVIADYLLPSAGPPVVRVLERTPEAAVALLHRAAPRKGEMIWIASQSGINGAVVEFALQSKKLGLTTVAFTSRVHSEAVKARHPSGQKLMDVCDEVIDLGGEVGDASVEIQPGLKAGALSSLGSIYLGHSILTAAASILESQGVRCVYTSVNTPEGEARNRKIESQAAERDPLLRG